MIKSKTDLLCAAFDRVSVPTVNIEEFDDKGEVDSITEMLIRQGSAVKLRVPQKNKNCANFNYFVSKIL